jgi:hypothetical protein
LRQPQEYLDAFGVTQIERHRALIEIIEPEEQAAIRMWLVVNKWANLAGRVASRCSTLITSAPISANIRPHNAFMITQVQNAQTRKYTFRRHASKPFRQRHLTRS